MYLSKVLGAATGGYLEGKGGRFQNNRRMQGMTLASLKHHYALTPLFLIMGAAITMVTAYSARMAIGAGDTNIVKSKEEDYAVNQLRNKAYKFLNPTGADHAKPAPIPDYKN